MLYDAYKNDLATRNFFKKLINFTAQGIDQLREHWLADNPPPCADFTIAYQVY